MKNIDIIVPVYNEEETIDIFLSEFSRFARDIKDINFNYVFVNDGSKDRTKEVIVEKMSTHPNITLINFSTNFGKEKALMAGLKNSTADACIISDVDLQDPLYAIKDFIKYWQQGYKIVYGVRENRDSDSTFKKFTAQMFYKFYNFISNIKIPYNAGDFRLLDAQVVKEIAKINDKNLFMKGIYHSVGFRSIGITYAREKRVAGTTKFNFIKLFKLALDGIFNSTSLPLRLSSWFGFCLSSIAFIYGITIIIQKLLYNNPIRGYPSIMATMLFFFGVQFIFMGLIGEYIARIFDEVKGKPSFVIESIIKSKSNGL